MEKPTVTDLAAKAGISKPYASEILAGKRSCARPLAIHIMRTTGWRHSVIVDLTDDELAVFERVEPWVPTAERPEPRTADRNAA